MLGQPGVPNEVRGKVLTALKEAGLMRPPSAATKGTIGIVIPGTTEGDYIAEVVRGIVDAAATNAYSTIFYSERNSQEHELIQMLRPGGCAGIIAVVPNDYAHLLDLCHTYGLSYALVDYQGDDELEQALTVEVDNRQNIITIMRYLH